MPIANPPPDDLIDNMKMLDIVLHRPEIPPNTGNVIRLCANTGARLHLYSLDTVGKTTGNTARHYWMPIARTQVPLASMKWLALHSMKGEGLGMAGHYGKPTHQEQYEAANVIGSVIRKRLGSVLNVVALLPDVGRDDLRSSA